MTTRAPRLDGARFLAIFAHPDDESLACGGTLIRAAGAGAHVGVVSVTPGGIGAASREPKFDPVLAAARQREFAAAAARLGVVDAVIWPFRDGLLEWWHEESLQAALRRHLEAFRPDVVITFGGDGLYWHPDHVQVHRQVTRAMEHVPLDAGLYYVTLPRGALAAAVQETCEREPSAHPTIWGIVPEAFGLHAEPATLVVDVGDVVDAKLEALRCHATQLGPTHPLALMHLDTARRWLGKEFFHLAPSSRIAATALDLLACDRPGQSASQLV